MAVLTLLCTVSFFFFFSYPFFSFLLFSGDFSPSFPFLCVDVCFAYGVYSLHDPGNRLQSDYDLYI